jgi:hypothetical protein
MDYLYMAFIEIDHSQIKVPGHAYWEDVYLF